MNEKLLTVSQAATLKKVSRSAIYKAISEGRLPHRLVLGHTALREVDVLAWTPVGRSKGTPRSEEVKAKISASQRIRWQRRKGKDSDFFI
jgi:excisionase family DNA binding protein